MVTKLLQSTNAGAGAAGSGGWPKQPFLLDFACCIITIGHLLVDEASYWLFLYWTSHQSSLMAETMTSPVYSPSLQLDKNISQNTLWFFFLKCRPLYPIIALLNCLDQHRALWGPWCLTQSWHCLGLTRPLHTACWSFLCRNSTYCSTLLPRV